VSEIEYLQEQVAHLKQLLVWEQANHRSFRAEIFGDTEFKAIFERRQREAHQQHTQEYNQKLLLELSEAAEVEAGFRELQMA